ncbi:MAG: phosphoesterase PA-phosphatase, partial [Marivirga sp.]|nr:phosphoesterase PA-phosphatase [Marivirga sp.]
MIMKKRMSLVLFFTAIFFSACSESEGLGYGESPGNKNPFRNHSNASVLQWNTIVYETMQGPSYDPMVASRIFAMVHIAMHDALNGIAPVYETYSLQQQDKKADPVAAISAAAYKVLVESFPDKKEQLDLALAEAIKDVKSSEAKEHGLALGTLAGHAIFALRSNDGAFQNPVAEINNPLDPGLYQPVPPTPFLYAPFWATLPTFALESPQQFRIAPMPALSSAEYARDFNEVKLKGSKENSTRTSEETTIAKFWYEFSEIGWNRVTATVAADKNLDLLSTAR